MTKSGFFANIRNGHHRPIGYTDTIGVFVELFILPAHLYPFLITCRRPPNLRLHIRLSTIARTARGRCGHPIATRHKLFAEPNGSEVYDSVAALDRNRNAKGARPLGLLGFFTGRSIHACDICVRKKELEASILCPCCGSSIGPSASVDLVASSIVRPASNERWHHLATTTVDGTKTVVCASCALGKFDRDFVSLRWAGAGVMDEHDLMKVRAYLATQAA